MRGQIILDFNNKKTVFFVILVELLFLFIFGNGALSGYKRYLTGHYVGDRNGAILLLAMFELPLFIALVFTVRKLITLQTLKTCGVAFKNSQIKVGDAVDFVVGLTVFRAIKIQEIIFTVTNSNRQEFGDGFGGSAFKTSVIYSKSYSLAKDIMAERNQAYTFPGNIVIPADAKPSGLIEKEELIKYEKWFEDDECDSIPPEEQYEPVYQAPQGKKLITELFEWKFQVMVKIKNCPDYFFEKEFGVQSMRDNPVPPAEPIGTTDPPAGR